MSRRIEGDGGPAARRGWMLRTAVAGLLLAATVAPAGELRLNEIQLLGTHNSYRIRPPEPLWSLLQGLPVTGAGNPADLDYGHPPLPQQLAAGIRSVELDLYADPDGGRYARRLGLSIAGAVGGDGLDDADRRALAAPGIKVLHMPDFDFGTNHLTLRAALEAVKEWSSAHPRHLPVVVHLETKDETVRLVPLPGLAVAAAWDADACRRLDAEIDACFPAAGRGVFTPDALRGTHASLPEALAAEGWPTVEDLRGQVLFVMEGVAVGPYLEPDPRLAGRRCFVYGRPGDPGTAFLLMNDPLDQRDAIALRVREGYMVRTRADAGTREARSGMTDRREAALASGAQIVSTDYPWPDPRGGREEGWTDYAVRLPGGGVARPNPVSAPEAPSPPAE